MSLRRNMRGDTIIEVLFAMAIIGVVLAAAYAVASKNLQVSQAAKERTQATELAISQLDQLKVLDSAPDPAGGGAFCIDVSQSNPVIDDADPACTVDGFRRTITKTDNEYRVAVEWTPPGGSDANPSIVEFFYSDYDFSLTNESSLAIYTISSSGTSAVLGSSILNQTGVLEKGVVYSTTNNPRVGDPASTVLPNTGASNQFNTTISGLDAAFVYYARTYIRNSTGYVYGNPLAINSSGATNTLPLVTTGSSSAITLNSATVAGTVVSDSGRTVTARGIAYGTNPNPTITNNRVQSGSGVGGFSATLTGLVSGTTYYARAYATNSSGTTYGQSVTFATLSPATVSVRVLKIPPATGNLTPSCTSAATLNRSGTQIRLNGTTVTTNTSSTATFTNLALNTTYTATGISAPAGHELCSTTQSITTGGSGSTVTNTAFKIRPICTNQLTGYNSYWARGNRRADLDNWFVTNDGNWPTWNTYFIAGHYAAPGNYWYQYSGSVSGTGAYYYLYEAVWRSDPIYQMVCPT